MIQFGSHGQTNQSCSHPPVVCYRVKDSLAVLSQDGGVFLRAAARGRRGGRNYWGWKLTQASRREITAPGMGSRVQLLLGPPLALPVVGSQSVPVCASIILSLSARNVSTWPSTSRL